MRKIFVLRGAPGSGKSTFIKNNKLEHYAVSSDQLRILFGTTNYDLSGKKDVPSNNDRIVWETLWAVVKTRMENGCLIIIDATNCLEREIGDYAKLAKEFQYDLKVVDFNVPYEELVERNKLRPELHQVREEVIQKFYTRKQNKLHGSYQVITPEEAIEDLIFKTEDYSKYEKIIPFGDLQGCFESLNEYFSKNPYNPKYLYIFVGDYLDRGIENDKVLSFMLEFSKYPNVVRLRGNHEDHLYRWALGLKSFSRVFNEETAPQLEIAGISKSDVLEFCHTLKDIVRFKYHEKTFTVTHAGLPFYPENHVVTFIPSRQYVFGIGHHSENIDELWNKNTSSSQYQIHGHRNNSRSPILSGRSINLEGGVEFGGYLRVAEISRKGIKEVKIKQTIIKQAVSPGNKAADTSEGSFLERLRLNPLIREKGLADGISSFNFTRDAFYKKLWDTTNTKARGLFIDTKTEKIVARSYDKFFNLNERKETELETLKTSLKYPVVAYQKDNGFLGILGSKNSELFFASKSSNETDFANWFKEIAQESLNLTEVKNILRGGNLTLVFEVNDPVNDPHIIKYQKRHVILLDVIRNEESFAKLDYKNLIGIGKKIGCEIKKKSATLANWDEFLAWYKNVNTFENELEGYVIEDAAGFMFKIKLPFYSFWKNLRTFKDRIKKGQNLKLMSLAYSEDSIKVVEWMKTLSVEELDKDIIYLREAYQSAKKVAA